MTKIMAGYGGFGLKLELGCKRDLRPPLVVSLVEAGMIDGKRGERSSMPSLHAKVVDQRWPSERRFKEEEGGLFAIVSWKWVFSPMAGSLGNAVEVSSAYWNDR